MRRPLLTLLLLLAVPTTAWAAGAKIVRAPAKAKVGQRITVLTKDLPAGRYQMRLVLQSNPGGESTPCAANIGKADTVVDEWAFKGRVPARLTCRLHGVGRSLGTVRTTPGKGYFLTICVPEGTACSGDGAFVRRPLRIVS